jgi:acyl-coenzyme A thioesterase 9
LQLWHFVPRQILEDLDALAGNIAFQHVFGTPLIVTAGVDRIRLRKRPRIDKDVHLSGKVTWVGNSSMEIRMQCADLDTREEWLEAYFTFVTLDPVTKKPIAMPALLPTTQEERAQFELGALKAQAKKRARRDKLQVGKPLTENSLKMDSLAASLLEEAGPLIRMPSLADPHSILMHNTKMQNAMVAQPQMQNLHNRIFGGFLMRRAFELAFATAYVFGGRRPIFLEVDDISFESPVDIGDLLVFNSRVLYTLPEGGFLGDYLIDHANLSLVMMEVEAWVTEPEKASARVSNHFYFTFALPKGAMCRKVLPSNIDEARRMSSRMTADREQATLRS